MRLHIWIKTYLLIIAFIVPGIASAALYTKTVSPGAASTVMSSGTPNLAANILEVGMAGVEYIPSAASETRAVANVTKGLSITTAGIANGAKNLIKANAGSLAVTGIIAGLVAGVDWIQKDGMLVKKSDGSTAVDTTTGGYYYWVGFDNVVYSTGEDACYSQLDNSATVQAWGGRAVYSQGSVQETNYTCVARSPDGGFITSSYSNRYGSGCPENSSYDVSKAGCFGSAYTPLSDSDYDVLDGFIQDQNGVWQQGLANEVCKSSSDYEACIANMGAKPYVTGPLSVSSPDVTTTTQSQNSDGSTTETATTTRTDYSLSYPSSSPGTISIDPKTVTTTTTTTKDSTGATTSTSTKTDTQTTSSTGEGTAISDGTYTDTPFPDPEPFYTQKYPDGFKGVWDKNKDAFMQSDFITFLNGFIPTFSGVCPSFGLSFDVMPNANFGYVDFWSMCFIFDFIKVVILVTAMFTCRALIFGG